MHASSAIRFSGATSRITAASAATASPAKSAIFDSAIPSSHTPVSPSESTHRRCSTCSRNPDHDAFPAGCFKRLNGLFTAGPTTSSRFSRPHAVGQRDPADDHVEHARVHLATDPRRDLVKRRERRQLQRRLDEHLQRDVDQIRRVVLDLRR